MLCHPQIESRLRFEQGAVPSLVIESPAFLRRFMESLYAQLRGETGELVLSEADQPIELSGWAEVIDNCFRLELNTKSLLNKITAQMERTAVEDTFFLKTADLLQRVESYIGELAFSFDCDLVCNRCTVGGLVKAVGVALRDEYEDPLERVLDYMELVREFDRDKLFIFPHLRSYFSDGEMERFLCTVLDHRYRVLLIESTERKKLQGEWRITIDNDLCEF